MNTTEAELKMLQDQIVYHRDKAASLRKRAAAQDAIADAKVREAAALGTPELEWQFQPISQSKTDAPS